ncbi:hypothetical protein GCM10028805_58840 [Spirosoma harenae]
MPTSTSKKNLWLILTLIGVIACSLPSLGQTISGTVFRDFNSDGVYATIPTSGTFTYGEPGIGGVTVTAYNAAGAVVATTVSSTLTSSLGSYTLTGISSSTAVAYRVEFTNLPSGYFESFRGSPGGAFVASRSSVRFTTGGIPVGATANTLNFGINYPTDYCQAVPDFVVPCYVNGNPAGAGTSATEPVLVTLPYTATSGVGNTLQETTVATNVNIGTVYGVAYQKVAKTIFTSAFVKRHSGLGTGGAGAIYVSRPSGTTYVSTLFTSLTTATTAQSSSAISGTTTVGTNTARGLPANTITPNNDPTVFDQVGKAGLGDLEISDDGTELYTVNLSDRRLYRIQILNPNTTTPTAGTITSYAITLPTSTTTGSRYRPFALKYYRGKVYVGGVHTNEAVSTTISLGTGSTGGSTPLVVRDTSGMKGYVYEFDPSNGSFTQVLVFPLTYRKGATNNDQTGVSRADRWLPWMSQHPGTGTIPNRLARNDGTTSINASYPQPLLAGIEFDVDGSMIISIRDRFGDQYGNENYPPSGTSPLIRAIAAGDILRAGKCNPAVNLWTLENNASVCGGVATAGASTTQGPGGGEYYYGDAVAPGDNGGPGGTFRAYHLEMSEGGLALRPGSGEVASIVMDPTFNYDAGGIRRFNNTTGWGSPATSVQIYQSGDISTYGKANGLGDLELSCNIAPVEIGNRVWLDSNNNGMQDADEPALANVVVTLSGPGLSSPVSVTTNTAGEYYFSNSTDALPSVTSTAHSLTGLVSGATYTLTFPTSVTTSNAYISSKPNSATGANADNIDTDASINGIITFTLGEAGENNFSFDVGYAPCAPPSLTAIASSASVCQGATETLIAQVSPADSYTYAWSAPAGVVLTGANTATATTSSLTATGTRTFTVTVSSSPICSTTATVSIVVNALPTPALTSATICAGQTATLTASGGTSYTFSAAGGSGSSLIVSPTITTVYTVTAVNANGCRSTTPGSATVTVNQLPTVTLSSATICAGQTASISATAGLTSYTLTSSLGSVTNTSGVFSVTPTANTSFTVVGRNSSGCSATATNTVVVNPIPVASATSTTITCTSSATVSGTSSLTGSTYAWSGPSGFSSSSQNFTTTTAGTYTLVVTSNGCSSTAVTTTVLSNTAAPTVSVNNLTLTCAQPTGTLSATVSNATSPTYLWSTGETTSSITVSAAIPYSVTVTSSNGCRATTSTTVQSNTAAPSFSVNSLTLTCSQPTGSLTVNAVGVGYLWSTGAISQSISVSAAGPYSVTVTAPNGCTSTTTSNVVSNTLAPTVSVNSLTLTCAQPTGILSATTTNATNPTYLWSTGATTSTIAVGSAIPYSVTVTSTNGCFGTTSTTVQSNTTVPAVSVNSLTLTCAQPTGTLSATATNAVNPTYLWSTGAITSTIAVGSAGPYSVTVTSSNGCQATTSTTVQSSTGVPTVSVNSLTLTCAQPTGILSATATNATNPTYLWSTGATTSTIAVGSAEPYSVTVASSNGCFATASTVVQSNTTAPAVSVNSLTLTCAQTTGTLSVTATNVTSPTYLWSTGAITASTSVSAAGAYSVTVTSANGCSATTSTTVQSNTTAPSVSVNSLTLTCAQPTATLSTTVTNATSPTYLWSNGATTSAISVSASGPYSVTVTSANGCRATTSTTVQSNTTVPAVSVNSLTLTCAQPTATLSATATNATNPTYLWSNGATTASISVSAAGPYSVTVTSANGCVATTSTTVQSNTTAPAVSVNSLTLTCAQPTGTLSATTTNATSPTYLWSNGATTASISVSAAGPYSVTVTSANGCSATTSTTVQSNTTVPAVTVNSLTLTCAQSSGTLSATATNVTLPTYLWSNGATTASISVSVAGPYSVTVTSANDCFATASTTVQSNTAIPTATISGNTTICQGSLTTLTASGGTSYTWSTGQTTSSISVSVSNTYSVTVATANGCSSTTSVAVTVNPLPTIAMTSATICEGQSATLVASGGTSYTFSTGLQNTNGQLVVTPGTTTVYSVTATDSNGCIGSTSPTTSGTATVNSLPAANVTASSTTICAGASVTLTASGGTSYSFSTGSSNSDGVLVVSPSTNTIYSVTVANSSGCLSTTSITVTVNPAATATFGSATICAGESVTLVASGGTSYTFSTGLQNTTGLLPVTPGTTAAYSVTVANASGCQTTSASPGTSATVTVNSLPVAAMTASSATICAGQSATITASGGTSYSFSTGEVNTTGILVVNPMTTTPYSVTIANATGCESSTSITINVNPVPTPAFTSATICAGQSATLTASGGTSYTFSTGDVNTTGTLVVDPTTTTTYSVTVANSSGCISTTTSTVKVNDLPTLTLSSETICQGLTTTLVATPGFETYIFSAGLTQIGSSNQASSSTAGTYSVTAITADGCSATAIGSITINTNPVVQLTSATICTGQSATLTATAGYTTYVFSAGLIQIGSSNAAVGTVAGTYSVTATSVGCSGTGVGSITIAPYPTATLTSATICAGESVTLVATGGTLYTFSNGTSNTTGLLEVTPTITTTYSVTVANAAGCESTTIGSVVVNDLPIAEMTSATICVGQSATLTATGGTSYSFSNGTSNTTGLLVVDPTATTPYSVTVANASGCISTATGTVAVNSLPIANLTSATTCEGQSVTLTASGGTSYDFSTGDSNLTGLLVVSPNSTTAYSVTVTTASGCVSTTTATVMVNPIPTIVTSVSCNGIATYTVNFTATAGASVSASAGTLAGNQITGIPSGQIVMITVTLNGCTETQQVSQNCSSNAASLGNYVWNDLDKDGIQDAGEPPIQGVTVTLYVNGVASLTTTTTDATGSYSFTGLTPGSSISYAVGFTTPAGYTATLANQGSDDDEDSDADPITGITQSVTLANGEANLSLDAGFYIKPASIGDYVFQDNNKDGIQNTGDTPLEGVTVTLYVNGVPTLTTTTNASGFYSFTGLTPGSSTTYSVGFTAPSGYTATLPNQGGDDEKDSDFDPITGRTQSFTLAPGQVDNSIDAGFYPLSAGLGNFVFEDVNHNGQQDTGEPGIPNVTVSLISSGTLVASTITDANGAYTFPGLTPGIPYSVSFTAPTGYSATLQNTGSDVTDSDGDPATGLTGVYSLTANEYNPTVDMGYYRPASLGDYVFADRNNNGIQDGPDTPLQGVIVTLISNGTVVATTTSDVNGAYSFTGLTTGTPYSVSFTAPANYTASTPLSGTNNALDSDPINGITASLTLASGENNTTIDAGFIPPTAGLGNYVWNDVDHDGIRDPSEPVLAGVTVTLYINGVASMTTTTDATGFYSFTGLTPGNSLSYAVGFSAPNGFTATIPGQGPDDTHNSDINLNTGITQPVFLSPGEFNNDLGAGFYIPTAGLGNYVFADNNQNGIQDAGDTPIQGVTVTLLSSGTVVATTITDATGSYSFTGLTPGTPYSVSFTTPAGYSATLQNIANDATDSDGDATGLTGVYSLTADEYNSTVDMGYYLLTPTLSLDKFVSRSKAEVGEILSYTVVLANSGNAIASNIVVRDSSTIGLAYVANSASAPAGTTFTQGIPVSTWTVGTINPGQSLTLTFQAKADSTGILYNTATIPGDTARVCTSIPVHICAGTPYTFQLSVPASRSSYQWYKDGIAIQGATSNTLDVSAPGSYSLSVDNAVGLCSDFSCCPFIVVEDSVPSFTAKAIPATCIGNTVQSNGQLVLSGFQVGNTCQFSEGATFNPATASPVATIPANGVIANNLGTPAVAQPYTIRVYNASGCYSDVTVLLLPTICGCAPDICVPFVIQQTKRPARIGDPR